MKFRWNSIFSLLLFLFSVLFQFARDTKNKNNPISQQNLSVWRVCARENEWSVSWTKSCFLFRFFLCCHKNKNTATKVWRFHQRPNHLAYIFKRVQKSAHNSPPPTVLQKLLFWTTKKFQTFLISSSSLFFFSSQTTQRTKVTRWRRLWRIQHRRKRRALPYWWCCSRSYERALSLWSRFRSRLFCTFSRFFFCRGRLRKQPRVRFFLVIRWRRQRRRRTTIQMIQTTTNAWKGRRKEWSRYRARFDASSRTGMVLPSKLCF